jgi:type IV pilus assembly protein PilE
MKAIRMRTRGFTLIELLVALAIMAIISAVAVPIYTEYSVRTQRTNAEKDLMMCAQAMERLASAAFSYAGLVGPGADTGAVTPNICTPSTTMYDIALVAPTNATTFTIRATPTSGPVLGNGILETDASGAQRWDRNNDGDFGDANETGWGH